MDITGLPKQAFKLKGKTAAIIAEALNCKIEVEKETKLEISEPGEYEVGGVSIIGFKFGEDTFFVFEIDGLRIAYLGSLTKEIGDEKISQLGSIDILIINVSKSTKESLKAVSGIDPYFVLPFNPEGTVDTFLAESGITVEKMDKFSIKREDILGDQSVKIVLLPSK